MTTQPSARIIADSISPAGDRVTTMEVVMHRFVLAEFNTHRVFSRNSASSRAIPLRRQLERVMTGPAEPVSWPAEQKGMQGGEELEEFDRTRAREHWLAARKSAVFQAEKLGQIGVHKSVANRLLEPFMWHTVVVTATAWDNFFRLRINPMAQPEIRAAATAMWNAWVRSTPTPTKEGEWHLPYISVEEYGTLDDGTLVKVSAARCARVSYLTQDGVRDLSKDIELYERLTSADPMHASPLEHVATPAPWNKHTVDVPSLSEHDLVVAGARVPHARQDIVLPKYGNLLGWHQHRFDVEAARGYRAFA